MEVMNATDLHDAVDVRVQELPDAALVEPPEVTP
jgi:hypothetical protein